MIIQRIPHHMRNNDSESMEFDWNRTSHWKDINDSNLTAKLGADLMGC